MDAVSLHDILLRISSRLRFFVLWTVVLLACYRQAQMARMEKIRVSGRTKNKRPVVAKTSLEMNVCRRITAGVQQHTQLVSREEGRLLKCRAPSRCCHDEMQQL